MSDLPANWTRAVLADLTPQNAAIIYGILQPGPDTPGGVPYVRPTEIDSGRILMEQLRRTTPAIAEKYARATLRSGDVLLSIVGTIGKVAITPDSLEGGNITQSSCRVRPNLDVTSSAFLAHFLRSPLATAAYATVKLGTAVPRLNLEDVRRIPVPLPPFEEQRRIVHKLDAVLSRVDACGARLDRVPQILKRFREAVLQAAVSGGLTEEWRRGRDSGWTQEELGNVILELRNGLSPRPELAPPGVPILRISSVRPFSVSEAEIRYLRTDLNTESYELRPKDLLFTRYSGSLEYVGVCGMVRSIDSKGLVYPDKLMRVRVDKTRVLPEWLEIVANSSASRRLIEGAARTSAGQTGISGGDIKALPIPLPALDEQAENVRRVEKLFTLSDSLQRRYSDALARVEELAPSILAKAFRGKLVPQDPKEESAARLLQRVRSAPDPSRDRSPKARNADRSVKLPSARPIQKRAAGSRRATRARR